MRRRRFRHEELERRVVLTPDQCVIDGKDFYMRGRILVPVIGVGGTVCVGRVGGGESEEFSENE